MLPVTVTLVNALVFVTAWIYPDIGFRYIIIAIINCLLLYTVHALVNSTETNPKFQLRFLETTRITPAQRIILIRFHAIIGIAYAIIFMFFNPQLDTSEIGRAFTVVQFSFQIINICSIPLWVPALKAWNSDKLEFIGKHPTTGEDWNGFMIKTGWMKWETDEEPGDHNVFVDKFFSYHLNS